MALFFIGSVLLAATQTHPEAYFACYFILFGGLVMTSLGHVLVFVPKSSTPSSTDKQSGNSSLSPQTIDDGTRKSFAVDISVNEYQLDLSVV
jgi:hypothetical protein